jgi:hypothetical protein
MMRHVTSSSRSKNNSSSPTSVVKYLKLLRYLQFSKIRVRIKSHNLQLVQPSEAPPALFFCSFAHLKYSAQNTQTHTHTHTHTKPVILSHFSYYLPIYPMVGQDSSVGIATRYGLDGPGIESQ